MQRRHVLQTEDVFFGILTKTGFLSDFIKSPQFNGWQLAKMKKSIPDMPLPYNL